MNPEVTLWTFTLASKRETEGAAPASRPGNELISDTQSQRRSIVWGCQQPEPASNRWQRRSNEHDDTRAGRPAQAGQGTRMRILEAAWPSETI